MDLLLSNIEMTLSDTLISLFMANFFPEIKAVSPLPKMKNSTPHRMKQSLEDRMLRDRCKAFISDHLFQELSQDANNYLQNPQEGNTLSGFLVMFFGFQSYLLRSWLTVLQ